MIDSREAPGRLPGMTACYWGSVNQWECDENNHMNVRYFAHKMNQAVRMLITGIGGGEAPQMPLAFDAQHIRFLAECRAATPLRVDCALVGSDAGPRQVLSLMHDNVTGQVMAAFLTRLEAGLLAGTTAGIAEIPEFARPRGLDPASLPAPPASWEQAREAGYRIVGRGIIEAAECDASGLLQPEGYIGRTSDGMPNLWAFLNPPAEQSARSSGALGGAALEQRLLLLEPLRAGSVFTQLSGVRSLGRKTQQMAHLLYDETRGRFAAAIEAVGVAMDLTTRRAVTISPERRRHLEQLLLR